MTRTHTSLENCLSERSLVVYVNLSHSLCWQIALWWLIELISPGKVVLMAAAGPATTSTTAHRWKLAIERAILTTTTHCRKHRQQATHLFTMALHTNDIISMLMTNQQFKFCLAIRTIVLV